MPDTLDVDAADSSIPAGPWSGLRAKVFSPLGAVVVCFLFSAAWRAPHLDRPLSDHHEWLTGHTLVTLDNWRTQGALDHNFALLQTYPSPADRLVDGPLIKQFAEDGKGYYTSFPPFGAMLPYVLFTALSIEPTPLSLQIFNLLGHFIASVFFYHLLSLVLSRGPGARRAAAVGTAAFILAAPNLWYFSNSYSWDTFWHYPWIIAIFLLLRIQEAEAQGRPIRGLLGWFGLAAFTAAYSDHQGVLFCGLVAAWGFLQRKKSRSEAAAAAIALVAAIAALGLMLYQYASLVGLEAFFRTTGNTIALRTQGTFHYWPHIVNHYFTGAGHSLLPVAVMSAVGLLKTRRETAWSVPRPAILLVYLLLGHPVLHALVFTQWTALHDYSIVKTMVFLAALLAWLFQKSVTPKTPRLVRAAVVLALVVAAVLSLSRYESHFVYSENTARYRDLGRAIAAAAEESETVFTVAVELLVPQVIYYARRNPQRVRSREEALEWMKSHRRRRGRLFYIDRDFKVVRAEALQR